MEEYRHGDMMLSDIVASSFTARVASDNVDPDVTDGEGNLENDDSEESDVSSTDWTSTHIGDEALNSLRYSSSESDDITISKMSATTKQRRGRPRSSIPSAPRHPTPLPRHPTPSPSHPTPSPRHPTLPPRYTPHRFVGPSTNEYVVYDVSDDEGDDSVKGPGDRPPGSAGVHRTGDQWDCQISRSVKRPRLLETPRFDFVWSDGLDFQPQERPFDSTHAGLVEEIRNMPKYAPCLDYFKIFFDDDLIQKIVVDTNNHLGNKGDSSDAPESTSDRNWTPVTSNEVYMFLGLSMIMPDSRRAYLKDYWHKKYLTTLPVFQTYMSSERYTFLLTHLYFSGAGNRDSSDRLRKIRPVFQDIREKFRTKFTPFRKVVIDNSLNLWNRSARFNVCMLVNKEKVAVEIIVMRDCETGIITDMALNEFHWPLCPYDDLKIAARDMMRRFEGSGRILYTNDQFTSPHLAQSLQEVGIGTVGTVRGDCEGMPNFTAKSKGDLELYKCKNMLALRWGRKRVMLTTEHAGKMRDSRKVDSKTREKIIKPDCVLDYKFSMEMMSTEDMQISGVGCITSRRKWYRLLFIHLVDICVLNAYHYYRTSTKKRPHLRVFIHDLANQILQRYGSLQQYKWRLTPAVHQPDRLLCRNYISKHYIVNLPFQDRTEIRQERYCYVCSNTNRRNREMRATTWTCNECQVPLCLGECFRDYHSIEIF